MKITVLFCAPDCSSLQVYRASCDTLEDISSVEPHTFGLDNDFQVIAVIAGWPRVKTRDDARTAEWGVL